MAYEGRNLGLHSFEMALLNIDPKNEAMADVLALHLAARTSAELPEILSNNGGLHRTNAKTSLHYKGLAALRELE